MGATLRIAVVAEAAKAKAELADLAGAAEQAGEQVERSLGGLGERIGKAFSGLGDQAKKGLAAAGAAAGTALVAGFSGLLQQGDLTAKLGVQMGLAGPEAAKAGKLAAQLYGENFGTDTAQVGEAIKRVYQDIGEGNDAWTKDITAKVLTVATTFEQDLGGTTAAVGQLLRTGLAKDATEALDIITKGLQSGADKSGDLLETFNEYGTQFRKVGIDGATATGLLSQGLQAGARDADIVADSIKEFSIRAVDGSKATADGFKGLGLNAKQMAADIAAGGPRANAALDLTLDRLRAVEDPVKRSQLAVALFGTQAEDLGDALFALDPSTAVQSLGKVSGAAQQAVDAMGGTAAAKIETFKRSITQGFTDIAGGLAGFATANSSWLVPLLATLGGIAAVIYTVSLATRAWAATQAAVVVVTNAWKAAQLLLNATFLANPLFLMIAGIVALVAAIVLAYKNSETFRNIVQAVWNAIKTAVSAVIDWITTNIPKLWEKAQSVWAAIQSGASAAWNAIKAVVSAVVSAIGAVIQGIVSVATAVWNAISAAASAVWNAIKAVVSAVITAITATINAYKAAATAVWNAIKAAADTVWNGIKTVISAVITAVTTAINAYKTAAVAVWTAIQTAASTAWDGIKGAITKVIDGIKTTLTGLVNTVKDAFKNAGTLLVDAGRRIVDGLKSGISGSWDKFTGWIDAQINKIPLAVRKALGISSPSKVMEKIGEQTGQGMLNGLSAQFAKLITVIEKLITTLKSLGTKMATGLADGVEAGLPAVSSAGKNLGNQAVQSVATSVKAGEPSIVITAGNVAKAVASAMAKRMEADKPSIVTVAGDVGKAVVQGLADGTAQRTPTATEAAASLGKKAIDALRANSSTSSWFGVGANVVDAFAQGIRSGNVNDVITSVVRNALAAATRALGISSPSKEYLRLGRLSAQGYALGLQQQTEDVQRVARTMVAVPAAVDAIDITRPLASAQQVLGARQPIVIEFKPSGDRVTDAILEMIRYEVRAQGGDVQAVLGRR